MTFHERKLQRIFKLLQECYPVNEDERKKVRNYRESLRDAKDECIWHIGSCMINKLGLK